MLFRVKLGISCRVTPQWLTSNETLIKSVTYSSYYFFVFFFSDMYLLILLILCSMSVLNVVISVKMFYLKSKPPKLLQVTISLCTCIMYIKILRSFFKNREHIQKKKHGPHFEVTLYYMLINFINATDSVEASGTHRRRFVCQREMMSLAVTGQ